MRAVTFLWVSVVPASPASGLEGLVGMGIHPTESEQENLRGVFVSLNCDLRVTEVGAPGIL